MKVWVVAEKMSRHRLINQRILDGDEGIDEEGNINRNLFYFKPEREFYKEGKKRGIDIVVLEAEDVSSLLDNDGNMVLFVQGEKVEKPDFVFPWTSVGTNSFSLTLFKQLEEMGVPMLNTSDSIVLAADKYSSLLKLSKAGLPIPKMMFVTKRNSSKVISEYFSFPVVLKTWPGQSGVGVMLVHDMYSMDDFISIMRKLDPSSNVLVQEYIEESKGRDIRVVVLDGEVLGMVERRALDGGFKSNFARKGELRTIPEIEEVKQIALEAVDVLGLNYAGVDILYDTDGYKICEVNSAPGFSPLEAAGVQPAAVLYDRMLRKIEATEKTNGCIEVS